MPTTVPDGTPYSPLSSAGLLGARSARVAVICTDTGPAPAGITAETGQMIRGKYDSLAPAFNEAALRLQAGAEARSLGHGGVSTVARATGLSRNTVMARARELDDPTLRGPVGVGTSATTRQRAQAGDRGIDLTAR